MAKEISRVATIQLPGAARSSQELPGAARNSQELPGAPRSSQELSGAARTSQELPGAFGNYTMEATAGAIYPLEEAIDHISILFSAQSQAKSTGGRLSSTGGRLSDKRRPPVKNARFKANAESDFL